MIARSKDSMSGKEWKYFRINWSQLRDYHDICAWTYAGRLLKSMQTLAGDHFKGRREKI